MKGHCQLRTSAAAVTRARMPYADSSGKDVHNYLNRGQPPWEKHGLSASSHHTTSNICFRVADPCAEEPIGRRFGKATVTQHKAGAFGRRQPRANLSRPRGSEYHLKEIYCMRPPRLSAHVGRSASVSFLSQSCSEDGTSLRSDRTLRMVSVRAGWMSMSHTRQTRKIVLLYTAVLNRSCPRHLYARRRHFSRRSQPLSVSLYICTHQHAVVRYTCSCHSRWPVRKAAH